jgi:hypothetical protein
MELYFLEGYRCWMIDARKRLSTQHPVSIAFKQKND